MESVQRAEEVSEMKHRRFWWVVTSLASFWASGCAGAPPFDAQAVVAEWAGYMDRDYVLRTADRIGITVYEVPELSQEITIAPNGQVSLVRIDRPIRAAGRSIASFRKDVQDAYLEKFQRAEVSVTLMEAAASTVYVAGEVPRAGPILYDAQLTLLKAVSAAGGYAITAKPSEVIIARKDGREKNRSFRVNLDEIIFGASPDFLLLPGDVVWVQTSGVADAGNWVELYIRRMLPFSLGAVSVPTGTGN
jgi:polysaccharide export outer membrane protein